MRGTKPKRVASAVPQDAASYAETPPKRRETLHIPAGTTAETKRSTQQIVGRGEKQSIRCQSDATMYRSKVAKLYAAAARIADL